MAWRPSNYLLEGELDNTTPNRVTGWMRFAGVPRKVTFDLQGDFHRDIRGAKIRFTGDGDGADQEEAAKYMDGIAVHQIGKVGDITAGLSPHDYGPVPYLEWYGDENGRVVIELEPEQVQVIGQPIPWQESDPVSREKQAKNMAGFLVDLCTAIGAPAVFVTDDARPQHPGGQQTPSPTPHKRAATHRHSCRCGGACACNSKPGLGTRRCNPSGGSFTHWLLIDGQVVGEARAVQPVDPETTSASVRLFQAAHTTDHQQIPTNQLLPKQL